MKFSRTVLAKYAGCRNYVLERWQGLEFLFAKKIGLYRVVNRSFSLPYKEKYSLVYQRISYHYLSFLLMI